MTYQPSTAQEHMAVELVMHEILGGRPMHVAIENVKRACARLSVPVSNALWESLQKIAA